MPSASERQMIDALVEDLRPVRRVGALWTAAAALFGAWLLVVLWLDGAALASGVWRQTLATQPGFAVTGFGLLLMGVGGSAGALAARVPDRPVLEARALAAAWVGLAVAAGGGAVLAFSAGFDAGSPVAADGVCMRAALLYGSPPGAYLIVLLLRGWVARPARAAFACALGAVALGALIVHLGCPHTGARHWLLGHALAPVVAAALGTVPLAIVLRRAAR